MSAAKYFYMTKRILKGAVLGNGPSRDSYDYTADVVIGCNIPGEGFSVDATVIADPEVVWLLKNNPELIWCPLIVSTKAYNSLKELRIDDQFEILDVFTPKDWYTSGHYAAEYLTSVIECATIDIWGCDSYFTGDATSITDQLIPKSGDLFVKQWRAAWDRLITSTPDVIYTIKR